MRWLLVVAVSVVQLGCTASFVLMRNDRGDVQRCDGATAQITGGLVGAYGAVNQCVEAFEQAGYHKVSDEGPQLTRRRNDDEPARPVRRAGAAPAPACSEKDRADMAASGVSASAIASACGDPSP